MKFRQLDVSGELLVEVCRNGVKLAPINAQSTRNQTNHLSNFLGQSFNAYFLDTESRAQKLNEQTLAACGWDSNNEIFGKSVIDVCGNTESLRTVIANDKEVICTDGISHHALSFKFPWYNADEKLIGLLGCTLVIRMTGYDSLPNQH